jgi:hypothetical protein
MATIGLTPAAASAQATTTGEASLTNSAQDTPCGEHWVLDHLYYNHCGETNVVIRVDRWNIGGISDYDKCVGPGDHSLGWYPDYLGAWYTGRLC